MDNPSQFNSSEQLLKHIQERSDDIEKALIVTGPVYVTGVDGLVTEKHGCGMFLVMAGGKHAMISRGDAALVLNNGILNRMRIPIEFADDSTRIDREAGEHE